MKFPGKVGNGPVNKRLNFGGNPDYCLDTGIVFPICHYWEIREVDMNLLLLLICQMAALVRHALAEVCTVPVLLVNVTLVQKANTTEIRRDASCCFKILSVSKVTVCDGRKRKKR